MTAPADSRRGENPGAVKIAAGLGALGGLERLFPGARQPSRSEGAATAEGASQRHLVGVLEVSADG